ncbi:MAG: class II fructose-1,6-bisphosphate aldolase [Candidatus Bathyarchaeia archaeon]
MSFVTNSVLLRKAQEEGYAVGAFNANNMEIVQAIIETAEEEKAPVILQASQGAIKYAGIDYITAMVKVASEKASVPVSLHLDHGTDFDQVIRCIRAGFSSVMFDGSKLPLKENMAITRKVVETAHTVEVSVEGELGRIAGVEDQVSVEAREAMMTDPKEAFEFVEQTGVDALAIAVGTVHGMRKREAKLDINRIRETRNLVEVPLVLHGASGVPDDEVQRAIKAGICKINIDTELRKAFVRGITAFLKENPDEIDPRKILSRAKAEMKGAVREKMRLFGCSGKG